MKHAILFAAAATATLSLAACQKETATVEANAPAAATAPETATSAAATTTTTTTTTAPDAMSAALHTVVSPIEVVAGATPAGPPSTGTLIAGVTMTDLYQVQAGKIAQAKAQSPAVKNFGKTMVTEHTAMTNQMKHMFEVTKEKIPTELGPRGKGMIAALNAAGPADFDRLYLDQQQAAQQAELSLLQDYAAGGASADLKTASTKRTPKVQTHLDMVNKLKTELK